MATVKNVLYVSYDGMTDPLGQSQVIPYLTGLTKMGFSFTILSCEKKDRYEKNKANIAQLLVAASIAWQPIIYTKSPPVLSTLFDFYQLKNKAGLLNKQLHFDIIHCRSYISALLGLWMKRKYEVPFVFDMRGFWADERIDGGIWNVKNPVFRTIYNYFKKKEIQFLKESAAVVSLTEAGKNEMMQWENTGITSDKITVIPCCADIDTFDPEKVLLADQKSLRLRLNIRQDDFIIGYLGSIGTWYMLDEMMCFYSLLKKRMPNARLLFVTQDDPAEILSKARKYDVDTADIIITGAGRKEVPLMISLFNYGLFFIKPAYSKMASSPTKQGEIMAMGIPVICNSGVGDTDKIITGYNSGLTIIGHNFDEVINKIAGGISYDSGDIRAGAIDFFSLENGVKKYSKIYHSILN